MRVPRDISLVGLDDGRSAQYHDITCYNHNVRGIARAILAHILRPPLPLRKRPASIAVEGYLAERGTLRSV
jgi:DNA-binding LacI/PurR family transcriptional regulator